VRSVVLRVVALALLLLLTLVGVIALRTLQRVPDAVVYFVRDRGTTFTLEPVKRRLGRSNIEQFVALQVAELAKGPTSAEAAGGLSSAVPSTTSVLSTGLADGVLTVNLAASFEHGGGTAAMTGRLAQLFYTLTQPSQIDAVVLQIEGANVTVFSGDGLIIDSPWVREEQPDLPVW